MRKGEVVFANFIVKFDELNLIDRLSEVVLPAFVNPVPPTVKRGRKSHLLNIEVVPVEAEGFSDFALVGRYVYEVHLRRTQYLSSGELVQDSRSLPSAPSALFAIFLSTHRLVYIAETANAPSLKQFETALRILIKDAHGRYIGNLVRDIEGSQRAEIRKSLVKETPFPSVSVVQLAMQESLESYLKLFGTLKRVEIIVHRRNDEVDGQELVESLAGYTKKLGAEQSKVTTVAPGGVDVVQAAEVLRDVASTGNQTVKLVGTDSNGNTLRGENSDFAVTTEIEEIPQRLSDLPNVALRAADRVVPNWIKGGTADMIRRIKGAIG